MAEFTRYVAMGDSFTEGVGDPDPQRPGGLRGWSDLVAEQLASRTPEFRYANLAIRGRLLDAIVDEQLGPALDMAPDLVTIYAGGNDMMRPKFDVDRLVGRYDDAVAQLTATGATVLVWTAYDAGWSPVFGKLRGRNAVYNELVREVADRHGATLVDFWRFDEYDDHRMWDWDRLHMSSLGHRNMAARVLGVLGVEHALEPVSLGTLAPQPKSEARRENLVWAREFLLPWISRRVRGTSSGDGVTAKRPVLAPVG
ncbi:SGNH/GDSL hydrolase family protein [Rhodococcus rhodnii]|uniref:SGNH hydrolase-type esterase domain-containing protein n=2 Tax=Rhodococcus rhodnii TaxID=38312 RepID=R7WJE6_9NOCA|nr:SGNH/GDSL hydrolase family protein [Rhodococcus rhodnii]EOM75385.1 hypothetical protein Rrhod_3183 [Rhodococcus rhodnii LMG 5362]TXG90574.1 SGNH/GDSL hydrolase family protein [Rhodococcus rhodnii]